MPSVNDIISVAEALEKSPIVVVGDNCVAVRNRNASCRMCESVCAEGAISVEGNDIELIASLCSACGSCATVCPTEALRPLEPTDVDLAQNAVRSLETNGDEVFFACARMASKRQADPSRFVEVPCLSRIDESIVLSLAASGAERVTLVDCDCRTCKYRANSPLVDEVIASVCRLIEGQRGSTTVERVTGFPVDLAAESADGLVGTTRRGFFSDAASAAKETAMTAAKTTIAQELGHTKHEAEIGERLRVGDNGALPYIEAKRHATVINSLDAIGDPAVEVIESRLFGTIDINVRTCNACGMCAMFCPTGALRRGLSEKRSDPVRLLEFSACDCVQCGLCVDVCWKDALILHSRVRTAELFDFEPRTFDVGVNKRS